MTNPAPPLLRVEALTKIYGAGCCDCAGFTGPRAQTSVCPRCGSLVACADVSFEVQAGEIFGIVGESGSGKSTVLRCLYGDERPTSGRAYLAPFDDGASDIFAAPARRRYQIRTRLLGMVYQFPAIGLRMDFSSGANIAERLLVVGDRRYGRIRERARGLLERTEVPAGRIDESPRRFSGGMQQRIQIAKALANDPPVLLLDEATTGLDASVQALVLDMIRELRRRLRVAMLVVSHDLRVIRLLAQRTAVMKDGRIVEVGLTDQILEDPQRPYTQLLVSAQL